ncbi:hypothetical protein VTK73DRAFT_7837 [Phialemonium thermophilum]|uniref:Uncharacterized protein n=1 Tax=Phialemonium thermophilum TaxID=223376 RepID=A0ABR3WC77_9PEZI
MYISLCFAELSNFSSPRVQTTEFCYLAQPFDLPPDSKLAFSLRWYEGCFVGGLFSSLSLWDNRRKLGCLWQCTFDSKQTKPRPVINYLRM